MTNRGKTLDDSTPPVAMSGAGRRSLARFRERWARFCRNRLAVAGLVLVALTLAMALAAGFAGPAGPFAIFGERLQAPSFAHWFGTDHLGRDILAGALYGARTSYLVGVLSVLMSVSIGIVVGALSGYYGGWVDDILMRITEIFQVMPRFFLALFVVAIFGANIWGIIFVIGVLNWAEIARLLRAEFMAVKQRPFVTAAHAYGANDMQIIVHEILPNAISPIIVAGALQVASSVLLEAALSFLGVGDPNVMSWGTMLHTAQEFMLYAWWTATFPGLAICLMTIGVALISDGLNDTFNPRLKEIA
jgi:peptide/nickel transport system permease protein